VDINIINQIGVCEDFMQDGSRTKEAVSIVVSPLKVTNTSENELRIVNGCNMWQACTNKRCHFSSGARKLPKIEKPGN